MNAIIRHSGALFAVLAVALTAGPARATITQQCPLDTDGLDTDGDGNAADDVVCKHMIASDGFVNMADGKLLYVFGFSEILPGEALDMAVMEHTLGAEEPAPTMAFREGQRVYLTVSNAGFMIRPDLFDPHSIHWHGFPNAAPIFDGMPDSTLTVKMDASQPYYYEPIDPGTYMYHCHVEATEHIQMGMVGQLYVRPKQNLLPPGTPLGSFVHRAGQKYAYNDGDGSTRYDIEVPLQLDSMDPDFHDASEGVQPLPFALMDDRYFLINGRGYPDTARRGPIPNGYDGNFSQKIDSQVRARRGQRVLLRLSNLSVTKYFTISIQGIPMHVIGQDAKILRGPSGLDLSYDTNSVMLGAGESADVILDTTGLVPGTYFLYVTNLNFLSNDAEDTGGMMTEVVILG
ncbi:MAG: multicopper oxidase domain-containing protein [Deltaproteobacteria bacterium]|nr:multicopper oxidase domain-containing protein [Deltaproteobacteria bacterium]